MSEIELPTKPRKVNTNDLINRLRKCAQRISDATSEKDEDWEEIGLMRDAADVIEAQENQMIEQRRQEHLILP